MSYEKYYSGGWQSGETGGTPITPEALNHMEQGIANLDSGKAPAGYGLGETAQGTYITSASDLDSIKKNGWYALWADYNIDIAGFINSFFTLEVAMFNDNYGRQTVHMASDGSVTRICNKGTWGEWEWVNPPMVPGVEYRTTKRHKGKPVYALMLPGGTLAGKTPFSIDLWDRNIAEFADWQCAFGSTANTPYDLTQWWGMGNDIFYKPTAVAIYGYNNMESACSDTRFYLEYTKTTD